MKLHGNAALSWSSRRRLAEHVLEQGWPLTATAADSRRRRALCPQVGFSLSEEGDWLFCSNHRRRYSALGHQPPVTRTNVLGSYKAGI